MHVSGSSTVCRPGKRKRNVALVLHGQRSRCLLSEIQLILHVITLDVTNSCANWMIHVTFCKGLVTPDSGESDLVETGPGFGGHSSSRCDIFLQDPLTPVSTGTRMSGPSTGSKGPVQGTALCQDEPLQ